MYTQFAHTVNKYNYAMWTNKPINPVPDLVVFTLLGRKGATNLWVSHSEEQSPGSSGPFSAPMSIATHKEW